MTVGGTLRSISDNPTRRTDRQAGTALLVGVIAFLLFGLSLFAGLRYFGPRVDFARQKAVSTEMTATVQKAIWAYVARNYKLPCPADGTNTNPSDANYGRESCGLTNHAAGIVPWRTLGLSETAAQDTWGNWLGYAASSTLSNTATKPYQNTKPANFVGKDAVNITVGGAASKYAYVLMSFGPDGGGFNLSGKQMPVVSNAKFTPTDVTNEGLNRTAITAAGAAQSFLAPASGNATGGQWLVYEGSAQICQDINGKNGQIYCGSADASGGGGGGAPGPGMNPLGTTSGLSLTSAGQPSNPNGVSSGAAVVAAAGAPVLVLGTNSASPVITAAPTLTGSSQACSWLTLPEHLTTATLRAYFEFSTVGSNGGDGFTFSLLPASTVVSTSFTPCGGTPGGQGTSGGPGNVNEGSYLGFEDIVDGGTNGSAKATVTVSGGVVTGVTVSAPGAGYQWVPPVEIRDSAGTPGAGATAYVSQMALNSITVTGLGFGYIAANPGDDPRPLVTVAPGGGGGYATAPAVVVETAAATGCTSGCSDATANAIVGAGGMVTGLQMTFAGQGYQRAPAVTLTSAAASGCVFACADAIGASAAIDGATGKVSGFFIGTDCKTGCTLDTAEVNSMAVSGVALVSGGAGYLTTPGGRGYSATPSVLIFDNNSNQAGTGQGAAGTATVGSGAVTGLSVTSGGVGYTAASVVVAGGGIGYFTVANVNNGAVSSLLLADNGQISANTGTYTELNSFITVTLPGPVHCSAGCSPAVIAASINSKGLIADYTIISGGSGYSTDFDIGNYVPVVDSQHQTAAAQIGVRGGAIFSLTLPATTVPQIPSVTVIPASSEPNAAAIVPANISAEVSQSGQIVRLDVNSVGSGYQRVPTIQISAPAICVQPATCNGSAIVNAMSVMGVKVDNSTNETFTAMPSIGIAAPDPTLCAVICYAATAAANTNITAIAVNSGGTGYTQTSTSVTLPPPMILPKLGIEFRTYHHPTDPYYSDYGYHDDWGYYGTNTGAAYAAGASANSALTAVAATQSAGTYTTQTQIVMPQAFPGTQSFGGNIRHDDGSGCDGNGCTPQYMSVLMVDSLLHDTTYHYSTASTNNGAYTISPSCDTGTANSATHDGGFVAGGGSTGGALASIHTSTTPTNAPWAGGCTYDGTNNTPIITNDGPISDTENNSGVHYHPVRVEIRRYCDPTCSSCGNQDVPGDTYIQVAAYLDCDSAALAGASCSDMSQNLLVTGTRVFSVQVTNGGSNYTSPPTVVIQGIGGDTGAGATATATVAGGAVTGVTISTSGSTYYQVPTVSFTGGGGTGATAVASLSGLPFPASHAGSYALNYCTIDPGATSWTSSHRGIQSLDDVLPGFTVGAGSATRGVLLRKILVGTFN